MGRLLAIDPGTREMGVAVLDGGTLQYHGVESFRRGQTAKDTLEQGRSIVGRLLTDFRPGLVVIERTFIGRNRNAALLNVLADDIAALVRRQRIPVRLIAPNTVRKMVCGNGRASKPDVARAVVARFPELKAFLFRDAKWKELFHANMFDAVALGMAARL